MPGGYFTPASSRGPEERTVTTRSGAFPPSAPIDLCHWDRSQQIIMPSRCSATKEALHLSGWLELFTATPQLARGILHWKQSLE
jgi:hypothetical protein